MFRVDFNNEVIKKTSSRLMKQFILSNIASSTFFKVSGLWTTFPSDLAEIVRSFKVFPFCIVIDPEMQISKLGPRLQSLFNADTSVIGRHITDVFTLLRPDILHIEWDKVCVSLFVSSSHLLLNLFLSTTSF